MRSKLVSVALVVAGGSALEMACASRPRASEADDRHRIVCSLPIMPRYWGLVTPSCTENRNDPPTNGCWSVEPSTGGKFVTVSASCGITDRGRVECWKPALASVPEGTYEAIDDDGSNACATRTDGGVACWGVSAWSELPTSPRFTAVAVGGDVYGRRPHRDEGINACGLTEAGDIECWGDGRPTWNGRWHFAGPFRDLDLSSGYVTGLRSNGELTSFLSGAEADLRTRPGPYSAMSANGAQCQLTVTGTLECAGGPFLAARPPPTVLTDVALLRAGRDHVCALHETGQVDCWGDARPPPRKTFRYISRSDASDSYCGIDLEGHAYCWGRNAPEARPDAR